MTHVPCSLTENINQINRCIHVAKFIKHFFCAGTLENIWLRSLIIFYSMSALFKLRIRRCSLLTCTGRPDAKTGKLVQNGRGGLGTHDGSYIGYRTG